jgi:homogentisate 1,2-dioxygenase
MIHYAKLGRIAKRAHQILRDNDHLVAEHVFTREGFSDLYSILYQKRAPTHETAVRRAQFADGFEPAPHAGAGVPERMHFRSNAIAFSAGRGFFESRKILLQNQDCTVGVVHASDQQQTFFVNGDADEMFFVAEGKGSVETMFGVLDYVAHDYLVIPRGVPYRFRFSGRQRFLSVEAFRGFGIPKEFLNHRMDDRDQVRQAFVCKGFAKFRIVVWAGFAGDRDELDLLLFINNYEALGSS